MKRYTLYILVLFISLLSSCEKDRDIEVPEIETETSNEAAMAETFYAMIYRISKIEADKVENSELSSNKTDEVYESDPCAIVSYHVDTVNSYVSELTINYTDTACYWGRKKYGKLKVYLDGRVEEIGTTMTIIPEGFYVSDKKVEGTVKIVNSGLTQDYKFLISKEVLNGRIWLNSDDYFTWNSSAEAEIDLFNDLIYYTTEATAVNQLGRAYWVETVTPLKSDFDCDYFQSGELKLKSNWGLNQSVNYGDGTCDKKAVLWQRGTPVNIELD